MIVNQGVLKNVFKMENKLRKNQSWNSESNQKNLALFVNQKP